MVAVVAFVSSDHATVTGSAVHLVQELGLGLVGGVVGAGVLILLLKATPQLEEALQSIAVLVMVVLIGAATAVVHGSGFLAVYVAGLLFADRWAGQDGTKHAIPESVSAAAEPVLFGLLGAVYAPRLTGGDVIDGALLTLVTFCLLRPAIVLLCLSRSRFTRTDRLVVTLGGLKGAVPSSSPATPLSKHSRKQTTPKRSCCRPQPPRSSHRDGGSRSSRPDEPGLDRCWCGKVSTRKRSPLRRRPAVPRRPDSALRALSHIRARSKLPDHRPAMRRTPSENRASSRCLLAGRCGLQLRSAGRKRALERGAYRRVAEIRGVGAKLAAREPLVCHACLECCNLGCCRDGEAVARAVGTIAGRALGKQVAAGVEGILPLGQAGRRDRTRRLVLRHTCGERRKRTGARRTRAGEGNR